eukprot:scaffold299849_cov17-Prasinocladus_malaysianus.AAC.1
MTYYANAGGNARMFLIAYNIRADRPPHHNGNMYLLSTYAQAIICSVDAHLNSMICLDKSSKVMATVQRVTH